MIAIRTVDSKERDIIKRVAEIHLETFSGFFLTFMGKGFLNELYQSFCKHPDSGLLVAFDDNIPVGFLAYSGDYSNLFKFMIRTKLIPFGWYSFCAFIKKPIIFSRLLRAFLKPSDTKRKEKYVELSSLGVLTSQNGKGIGSKLITKLIELVDFKKYKYISLETDAINNDRVNKFYQNNGFILEREFKTREGRKMNEYRYTKNSNENPFYS